jgi:protein TonB
MTLLARPAEFPMPRMPALLAARGARRAGMSASGMGMTLLASGAAHAALVLAAVYGGLIGAPEETGEPRAVAEVALMSGAAFDAMASEAPVVPDGVPDMRAPDGVETTAAVPAAEAGVARALPDRVEAPAGEAAPVAAVLPAPVSVEGLAPEVSGPVAPVADASPQDLETGDGPVVARSVRAPAEPVADVAPVAEEPPPARAKAERAAPSRAAAASGEAGASARTAVSGGNASAVESWGKAIRKRIARAKVLPGKEGATGRVKLILAVSASGALQGVSVVAGSGVQAVDEAALATVRRAGRLPKAPAGVAGGVHEFTITLSFEG